MNSQDESEARISAIVSAYSHTLAQIHTQIRTLMDQVCTLREQDTAVYSELVSELLSILRERVWAAHPGWSRDAPSQVYRIDRMAKREAEQLVIHRYQPSQQQKEEIAE